MSAALVVVIGFGPQRGTERRQKGKRASKVNLSSFENLYQKAHSAPLADISLAGQGHMAIPSCKEIWEFDHSREGLERMGAGWVFSKLIPASAHRETDF